MNYALQRAVETMEFNYEKDSWEPVVLHAILLLGYLDPQNGFEKTLQLFRQPAKLSDQYIEDWRADVLQPYFFRPFDGILPMIKAFVLEPLTPVAPKNEIIDLLKLLAQANSAYQVEIHQLLEDLMKAFRDQQHNPDLMDWNVTAFLAMAAIDTKATHLLPIIKELSEAELLSPAVAGDYDEIVELMEEDDPLETRFFEGPIQHIKNLDEIASNSYGKTGNTLDDEDFDDDDYDYDGDLLDDDFDHSDHYDHHNDKPVESFHRPQFSSFLGNKNLKKSEPSVNNSYDGTPRNAPCPCGSGKKYKRCHGA